MNEKKPPRSIRLEPELDSWLKVQAKAGDRSMNAEINRLIRQVKEASEQKQTAA